jgi:ribosome biogenesis GTPase / thiamine phosphate phosphatase
MSRRKLNNQQTRRVRNSQGARAACAHDSSSGADDRIGVVIARLGTKVDVEDRAQPGAVLRCHMRANLGSLVAGDHVVWRNDEGGAVVVARLERRSVLRRPDMNGRPRAVAANLDQLLVVIAPEPEPHANLLDRYLVAAEDAGIRAMIVLNKSDLLQPSNTVEPMLEPYRDIGYRVLRASARMTNGLAELRDALRNHTTAIVGQSGVGKSSLAAMMLPEESLRVGRLSTAEIKGRHTTSAARLYHLPQGGDLIDSPGIRDFSLTHIDAARTARGFIEFRPFLGQCRFRDCEHRNEPGCSLRAAVESGRICAARYRSYLQIVDQP